MSDDGKAETSRPGSFKRRTSDAVADGLREAILTGRLSQGQRLAQEAISRQLGVSQTVVREAFKSLVGEGFLDAEPRRGVKVAKLGSEEVQELTALRALLEPKLLEWALPNLSEERLQKAASILDELDHSRSLDELIRLNALFHQTLYEPCGRRRSLSIAQSLRSNFERYLRYVWTHTCYLSESQQAHRQLLGLCRSRRDPEALALLSEHIRKTGATIAAKMSS